MVVGSSCKNQCQRKKTNARRRRRRRVGAATATATAGKVVQVKFQKLRRLLPGGHGLHPDQLFLHTADYILHLQLKLNVLQAILNHLHAP